MRFFILFFFLVSLGYAKEYVVIANSALQTKDLTQESLRRIFLKKRHYIGEIKLVPLNQKPNSAIRRSFEQEILHMSRHRLKRYWTVEHYKGVRPPIPLSSDMSVIKFVQKVKGAIGYVDAAKIPKDANVHILYSWSE